MKFKAVFTPDEGGAWNVAIPTVAGCHTWGRSLTEARRNIREALEVSLEDRNRVAIARDADIEEDIRLPANVQKLLVETKELRGEFRRLIAKKHALEVRAAASLTRMVSLGLRDTGDLLELSQEGVRKLLQEAPRRGKLVTLKANNLGVERNASSRRNTKSTRGERAPGRSAQRED